MTGFLRCLVTRLLGSWLAYLIGFVRFTFTSRVSRWCAAEFQDLVVRFKPSGNKRFVETPTVSASHRGAALEGRVSVFRSCIHSTCSAYLPGCACWRGYLRSLEVLNPFQDACDLVCGDVCIIVQFFCLARAFRLA